ncbi:MAG TPA: putative Ig domain-containing protein [Steroidobacteraceae bacterium]|nr:putative Ig domain-containing protein [Steroidobacteraceae bacterium]
MTIRKVPALLAALASVLFSIPATHAATNQPPRISGTPPASVQAGKSYYFQPQAYDPERRRLTFSITNKPSWAQFSSSTGRLYGTPATRHAGTTSGIVIRVSDGRLSAALPSFSITVTSGTANRAPVVSGTPATTATVGTAWSFRPTGSDPDGDAITWSIANKPSGATFSTSTGQLGFTPTATGTWSGIVITATDSKGAAASLPSFAITVNAKATTGSATLSWQAPVQYTDGSQLAPSSLGAFRIYRGTSASNLSRVAEVDGQATSFVVQNLPAGTHYFAVTAVTTAGAESARSAVGSKTIR